MSLHNLLKTTSFYGIKSAIRRQSTSAFRHMNISHPTRGGQNLSNRHVRLEQSLLGKNALEHQVEQLRRESTPNLADLSKPTRNEKQTFRGLVIPMKPKEPSSDECCMSGCAICVYDLYDEALTAYKDAVGKVKATLKSMNVPESDWPSDLRDNDKDSGGRTTRPDVTLSVFEEMERRLQAKRLGGDVVSGGAEVASSS
ncbi:hypothetical protein L218DRAFT_968197 [Marasmius fiardii PR-910]|nr:hypothetical protein L218DRAFT_968197 [Marasmius fiardii PR-910]